MSRNQQAADAQDYQASDAAADHSSHSHSHDDDAERGHGHSHGGGTERARLLLDGRPISATAAAAASSSSGSGSHHHHHHLLPEGPHIFSAFGLWSPVYILAFTLGCFLAAFVIGRPPHCDPALQTFLLATAGVVVAFMSAFMIRDVREQRRRSEDDDSDSCDWLVWFMRVLFLGALVALAIWGKMLLDAEAASAAAEASNPAAVPSPVDPSSADSTVCKEGHDGDLVYVCWWMVLIEASVAAVAGGVILAQGIASACDW